MTPTFLLRMDPIPPSSKKVHPYTFDKEQLTPVRPNFVRFVKSCQALSEILDFSLKSKYIQSGTLIHFTLSSQASSEISFEKATRTPFSWAKESKTLLKTSRVSWPAFPEREQHSPNTVLNDPPFFSHTLVVSFITFTAVSCISFFFEGGRKVFIGFEFIQGPRPLHGFWRDVLLELVFGKWRAFWFWWEVLLELVFRKWHAFWFWQARCTGWSWRKTCRHITGKRVDPRHDHLEVLRMDKRLFVQRLLAEDSKHQAKGWGNVNLFCSSTVGREPTHGGGNSIVSEKIIKFYLTVFVGKYPSITKRTKPGRCSTTQSQI